MLETEFVRSLQSNYERIHLQEQPDEQRYQYCILTRGGIRGLLPCSLRYVNGEAYLYYDITSRQNVAQLYGKQMIDRSWVRDFFWSYEQVTQELGRFLLDDRNILVYPEQIFEDLGNRNFFFLYLPYNEEGNGFGKFLEFVLEHMDYEDTELVECMYLLYEQYDKYGEIYLQAQVFEDIKKIAEKLPEKSSTEEYGYVYEANFCEGDILIRSDPVEADAQEVEETVGKKGFWERLALKIRKNASHKLQYKENIRLSMEGMSVAEAAEYEEDDYGKTVYIEQKPEESGVHKLYSADGRVAAILDKEVFVIGKQREEVDLVLEDDTVSRIHARIYRDGDYVLLEDLNATNGTFKNGLRFQPYEKRRLEDGDELRFGKLLFVYR